jgi:hypothetical protein
MLCASRGEGMARMFLFVFGAVYGLVAVLGFVMQGDVLGIIQVNAYDNYLHLGIAVACLGVAFNSSAKKA